MSDKVEINTSCDRIDHNSLLLLKVGNEKSECAYKELYIYFFPRICALLAKRGVNDRSAQDIAQDVMIKVWRKADQFDATRAKAATWIYAITRNLLIDTIRGENRRVIDTDDPTLNADQQTEAIEISMLQSGRRAVAEALQSLPPDQERILRLSFIHGKKQTEIAEELSMPLNTVKSKIRRGIQYIRKSMEAN